MTMTTLVTHEFTVTGQKKLSGPTIQVFGEMTMDLGDGMMMRVEIILPMHKDYASVLFTGKRFEIAVRA